MASGARYELEIPAGFPPPVFLGLYTAAVKKQLLSLLTGSAYEVRVKEEKKKEKYAVTALRGALNGAKVEVGMKKSLFHQELAVVVEVKPYSKVEQVLQGVVLIIFVLCLIPTWFAMVALIRFIILAFVAAIIVLIPLAALLQVLLLGFMTVLYRLSGNEFDLERRTAIAGVLKQVPPPDLAKVLAAAQAVAGTAPAPPAKG